MEYGQRMRARMLGPFLQACNYLHCTPDHFTIASLLCGLGFGPSWYFGLHGLALVLLALHVIIDGLDGPLARFQHVESPRGSFTDSFSDQVVVSTVAIALMLPPRPWLGVLAGSLYLVLYAGVLSIAIARNSLAIPYSWLIRPRFFLYLAIPLELLGVEHSISIVVWLSNGLLLVKLVTGFFKLRSGLGGPKTN